MRERKSVFQRINGAAALAKSCRRLKYPAMAWTTIATGLSTTSTEKSATESTTTTMAKSTKDWAVCLAARAHARSPSRLASMGKPRRARPERQAPKHAMVWTTIAMAKSTTDLARRTAASALVPSPSRIASMGKRKHARLEPRAQKPATMVSMKIATV